MVFPFYDAGGSESWYLSLSHHTQQIPRGAIFQNLKILKKIFSKPRLIPLIYQTPLSLLFYSDKMNNNLKI
jgi:hypothetical protein